MKHFHKLFLILGIGCLLFACKSSNEPCDRVVLSVSNGQKLDDLWEILVRAQRDIEYFEVFYGRGDSLEIGESRVTTSDVEIGNNIIDWKSLGYLGEDNQVYLFPMSNSSGNDLGEIANSIKLEGFRKAELGNINIKIVFYPNDKSNSDYHAEIACKRTNSQRSNQIVWQKIK